MTTDTIPAIQFATVSITQSQMDATMRQIHKLSDERLRLYRRRCQRGTPEYLMRYSELKEQIDAITNQLSRLWDERRCQKAFWMTWEEGNIL